MTYYQHWLLRFCLLFCLSFSLCIPVNAIAQSLSPGEAAEQAKARTGGKVLKVKQKKEGGYRVKVLMPNGQVRNIYIGKSKRK